MQKKTRLLLLTLFWMTLLPAGLQTAWSHPSFALPDMQSDCIEQTIGDAEVIAEQALDVNQDGISDRVVLYINQTKLEGEPADPIYILLAINWSSEDCRVILNEYLASSTLTTGRQEITVHTIEMVELTGDDKPELHIWLDRSGGGARYNWALHAILLSEGEDWTHILGNVGITQCLTSCLFEFRDAPTGDAKDIYLDSPAPCEPPSPWSSCRAYTIMRWNGSRFMPAERGTINVRTTGPSWPTVCCVGTLIGPVAFLMLATALVFAIALVTSRSARG